jgi:hypothetical protein
MRPWQALGIAVGSALVWWGVRALVSWPDAVGVLRSPVVWVPLVPVVLALTLLHRRRLGRLTSRGFVAQAVVWQLFGLARPTLSGSGVTSLLTRPFVAPQPVGLLGSWITWPYNLLGVIWCLMVVWLALVAWIAERAPLDRVPAPVGSVHD